MKILKHRPGVSMKILNEASPWCEYEDFERIVLVWVLISPLCASEVKVLCRWLSSDSPSRIPDIDRRANSSFLRGRQRRARTR